MKDPIFLFGLGVLVGLVAGALVDFIERRRHRKKQRNATGGSISFGKPEQK